MSIALWRDISVVWLSLFCFVALVIPIVILYFAVRGMNFVQVKVHQLFQKAQGISRMVRVQTEGISEKVADPVIQVHGRFAQTRTWLQSLWADGK
ncbi:MAG: hypothetical protein NT075_03935 [Chloroflexi bacterium]|nr:hypothetical protein [Chloroflexota bacterium]